jgi:ELWxxDGT repeat protein
VEGPPFLFEFNNKLYFVAGDGTNGQELWVYDATSPPTMVADINPNGDFISIPNFGIFNEKLYFSATNGINGEELWEFDGSSTPTMVVANINPTGNSFPR